MERDLVEIMASQAKMLERMKLKLRLKKTKDVLYPLITRHL